MRPRRQAQPENKFPEKVAAAHIASLDRLD
jgi:hypothetical protein